MVKLTREDLLILLECISALEDAQEELLKSVTLDSSSIAMARVLQGETRHLLQWVRTKAAQLHQPSIDQQQRN